MLHNDTANDPRANHLESLTDFCDKWQSFFLLQKY